MCMKNIELCQKKLPEIYPQDIYRGVNYTITLNLCGFYTPKWSVIVYCKEKKYYTPPKHCNVKRKLHENKRQNKIEFIDSCFKDVLCFMS